MSFFVINFTDKKIFICYQLKKLDKYESIVSLIYNFVCSKINVIYFEILTKDPIAVTEQSSPCQNEAIPIWKSIIKKRPQKNGNSHQNVFIIFSNNKWCTFITIAWIC